MTKNGRIWTIGELDLVWPLPDGWEWSIQVEDGDDGNAAWSQIKARRVQEGSHYVSVWIDEADGGAYLGSSDGYGSSGSCIEVYEAMLGAYSGRDSPAFIAAELARIAHECTDSDDEYIACESANAYFHAAHMVKNGRVETTKESQP